MYSEIHCMAQNIMAHEQLSAFEICLPQNFVKVHRSYLVNAYCVEKIERYQIRLINGDMLPVPEKKYKEVKEKIRELKERWPCRIHDICKSE